MKITVIALALATGIAGLAQTTPPAPTFEVASIRPSEPGPPQYAHITPGAVTMRGVSLEYLVMWAYSVPPFEVLGPAVLRDSRFDVAAKTAGPANEDQMRLMMRALLADRFGFKFHREKKEMQVYLLTLAKGGPKFKESTGDGPPLFNRGARGALTAFRVSMQDICVQISDPLKQPVVDGTGLTGRYDMTIDPSAYMLQAAADGKGGDQMDVMGILFNALQTQLGVKLESKKDMVDALIVDHIESKPTEN